MKHPARRVCVDCMAEFTTTSNHRSRCYTCKPAPRLNLTQAKLSDAEKKMYDPSKLTALAFNVQSAMDAQVLLRTIAYGVYQGIIDHKRAKTLTQIVAQQVRILKMSGKLKAASASKPEPEDVVADVPPPDAKDLEIAKSVETPPPKEVPGKGDGGRVAFLNKIEREPGPMYPPSEPRAPEEPEGEPGPGEEEEVFEG